MSMHRFAVTIRPSSWWHLPLPETRQRPRWRRWRWWLLRSCAYKMCYLIRQWKSTLGVSSFLNSQLLRHVRLYEIQAPGTRSRLSCMLMEIHNIFVIAFMCIFFCEMLKTVQHTPSQGQAEPAINFAYGGTTPKSRKTSQTDDDE